MTQLLPNHQGFTNSSTFISKLPSIWMLLFSVPRWNTYPPVSSVFLVLCYKIPFPISAVARSAALHSLPWLAGPWCFLLGVFCQRLRWGSAGHKADSPRKAVAYEFLVGWNQVLFDLCFIVPAQQVLMKFVFVFFFLILHKLSHWVKIRKINFVFSQWQTTVTARVLGVQLSSSPLPTSSLASNQGSSPVQPSDWPPGLPRRAEADHSQTTELFFAQRSLSMAWWHQEAISSHTRYASHFQTSSLPKSSHLDEWSNL